MIFDITPIRKIQSFPSGILIIGSQKTFKFCIPPLKTPRPVLP
jgi:hypothetical protein